MTMYAKSPYKKCPMCGKSFYRHARYANIENIKYCSQKCMQEYTKIAKKVRSGLKRKFGQKAIVDELHDEGGWNFKEIAEHTGLSLRKVIEMYTGR